MLDVSILPKQFLSESDLVYRANPQIVQGQTLSAPEALILGSTTFRYAPAITIYAPGTTLFYAATGVSRGLRSEYTLDYWLPTALADLQEAYGLGTGWDGFGANSVTYTAAVAAQAALSRLVQYGAPKPRVTPTVIGGVDLEWFGADLEAHIEFDPEGAFTVSYWRLGTEEAWAGDGGEEPEDLIGILRETSVPE